MDECEEEETMNMNTGKYFDEGVMEDFIDIPADEDEETKRQAIKVSAGQRKKRAANAET